MQSKRVVSLCQMAIRSGKVAYGSQLIPSIQNSSAKVVLYAFSCGNNRKKKLNDKCSFYQIPIYEVKDTIFFEISKNPIQSLAILDDGFSKAIIDEMKG